MIDWKTLPDGKEKYQAYLASREWFERRQPVLDRSGGNCERCKASPYDHVHHLTYIRIYKEEPEDLQAICKGCHDFIHKRSDVDPLDGGAIRKCWRRNEVGGRMKRNTLLSEQDVYEHDGARYPDSWHELLVKYKAIEYAARGIQFFKGYRKGGGVAGEKRAKAVRCVNGKVNGRSKWPSIRMCADDIGITDKGLCHALREGRPIRGGLLFEKVA